MLQFSFSVLRAPMAALGLSLLLVWPAAQAGSISAFAAQNLVGTDQASSPDGSEVLAQFGQASARATRRLVLSSADGAGAGLQTAFQSSAGNLSTYTLWDIGSNLPVAPVDALQIELDFTFELEGSLIVGPTSVSTAGTQYLGGLASAGSTDSFTSALSVSYGPMPGGLGYLFAGDSGLSGSYSRSFTSRHAGAAGGSITMILSNTAANDAIASSSMSLVSIGLIDGAVPSGGLGVRITETGLIIPVTTPVPEPATALLAFAGLGVLLGWRRLQRR